MIRLLAARIRVPCLLPRPSLPQPMQQKALSYRPLRPRRICHSAPVQRRRDRPRRAATRRPPVPRRLRRRGCLFSHPPFWPFASPRAQRRVFAASPRLFFWKTKRFTKGSTTIFHRQHNYVSTARPASSKISTSPSSVYSPRHVLNSQVSTPLPHILRREKIIDTSRSSCFSSPLLHLQHSHNRFCCLKNDPILPKFFGRLPMLHANVSLPLFLG